MKDKRGFTLIELLAVIVILAIIALIATPIVVDLIEDSRKSAAENATNGILSAAEVCYGRNIMDDATAFLGSTYEYVDGEVTTAGDKCPDGPEFKGAKPVIGTITVENDGKIFITAALYFEAGDIWCGYKDSNYTEIKCEEGNGNSNAMPTDIGIVVYEQ